MKLQILLDRDFADLSRSMQKALAFMGTRHLLSFADGSASEPGDLGIHVAHPDYPCRDYDDMTSTVFGSSRILDAMIKRELVAYRFVGKRCLAELTPDGFGLATGLMTSIHHGLLHHDD